MKESKARNKSVISLRSSNRSGLENLKLLLEVLALSSALFGALIWTVSWSGKSPEMTILLEALSLKDDVILKADIEVKRVDFKVETVAIRVGEKFRIWQRKLCKDCSLEQRLTSPEGLVESHGNLKIGSCELTVSQLFNRSANFTAGDRRSLECHIPVAEKSEGCTPVVLRIAGQRALPNDWTWFKGEFFATAVACEKQM